MEYFSAILTVSLIHLLAVMSPGPDFIMILRNSLLYSRRDGMFSAVGLALGNAVHITYCMLGIALVISRSIVIFSFIKYLGAAYLLWIGFKSLRAHQSTEEYVNEPKVTQQLGRLKALRLGFITNATNPKATLFFLSLFTLVIRPGTPLWVKSVMGIEMMTVTVIWFSLVSTVASHNLLRRQVAKIQHKIERLMGGILILFGIKLASERLR